MIPSRSLLAHSVVDSHVDQRARLGRDRLANDVLVDEFSLVPQRDSRAIVGAPEDVVIADQRRADGRKVADRDDASVGTVAEREHRVASDHRERSIVVRRDPSTDVAPVERVDPHPVADKLPRALRVSAGFIRCLRDEKCRAEAGNQEEGDDDGKATAHTNLLFVSLMSTRWRL